MTGIIFTKLRQDKFSLVEFYLHRARRIIPALAFLCIVLLVFGFMFLSRDYKDLLQFIRKTILFISNITYYRETDYFATPSQYNWLLHTWSLSVEWQFYLVYPIIILLCYKFFSEKVLKWILLSGAISSLILSIVYTPINSSAAFYLLPTRVWEMLSGGLVFLFPIALSSINRKITYYLGLVLIIGSIFLLNENFLWPGYLAIIPILGSVLIIFSANKNILTDNYLFQQFGKISYSIYLWHWPIVVLLNYCNISNQIFYVICGISLSFVFGFFSYCCIETVFKLKRAYWLECVRYIVIILVVIGVTKQISWYEKNKPSLRENISNAVVDISCFKDSALDQKYKDVYKNCIKKSKDTMMECIPNEAPSFIVLGDSHAGRVYPIIAKLNGVDKTIGWSMAGCQTADDVPYLAKYKGERCDVDVNAALNLLDQEYKGVPIIIVNRYSIYLNLLAGDTDYLNSTIAKRNRVINLELYKNHYIGTMCRLAKTRKVYLLKPIPEMSTDVTRSLTMQSIFSKSPVDIIYPLEKYNEDYADILSMMDEVKNSCNVELLDPIPYLCFDGKSCNGSITGKPLYSDDNHLNLYGGELLIPLFQKIIEID